MKIEYLDLKNNFRIPKTIEDDEIITYQNKEDYHLNKTLILLPFSGKEKVFFSFLIGKIFKISLEDYRYIENFSEEPSFPKLLLDLNIIVERKSKVDENLFNLPTMLFENLQLNLSSDCNLRCRYCYASGGRRSEKEVIPFFLVKKAINYISRYCQDELNLIFVGGGEPTLQFGLLKQIVSYAKKKIKKVIISPLSTNGIFSQEVADWLIKNVDNIQISCDGPSFIQDKYRPLTGGKGSSFFVEKTIKYLKRKNKDFRIRATLIDDTFGNDAVYKEQEVKAKEAVGVKSATKQQILLQPALVETRERIDDLRIQIKEAEEVLSDYLIQFQKSTGFNEIEANNGETLIIVNHAKLVKGVSQKQIIT